jgi:PqqD family protein of HPr-rel-A system
VENAADEAVSTTRWSAATELVWTHYDDGDEWAVYNPFSADIHLLTGPARQLLALVSAGPPSSSEELATRLANELGRALDSELRTVTRETLELMDSAGLVRRATP